ncbi:Crp/Fnr family transcriptional regulator [Rhodocytophaga aerolata]|uniref:Crp/Fnr family transcriptional regulator n=1 Tax=Rhodocytophaga aerolata TaxID=455078 RepID=A0ABT8RF52_9BACT|nr:Crp/Fnr family transcriptional regulator [Rhodocytophaga aerolata]MDO1449813.1 Crp/Fnr family transcriptional regulator [Rhodocytophaga aerolata]
MYDSLFVFLSQLNTVSGELKEAITRCLTKQELKKKTLLLQEGKVCDRVYFIEKGLARAYYFMDGQEITSWFMKENDMIISVYSFFSQRISYENMELEEDSILISITNKDLQMLYRQFPEFNFFGRVLTEDYYVRSEERIISHRMQTAEQRYEALFKSSPSLFNRVLNKHIASYLGMSAETLSRIRKKRK